MALQPREHILYFSGYDEIIRAVFHADESENGTQREKKKKKKRKKRKSGNETHWAARQIRFEQTGENASSTTHSKYTKKETIRISIVAPRTRFSLSWCRPRGNRTKIIPIVYDRSRIVNRARGGIPLEKRERERETTYLSLTRHDLAGGTPIRPETHSRNHVVDMECIDDTRFFSVSRFTVTSSALMHVCVYVCPCTCVSFFFFSLILYKTWTLRVACIYMYQREYPRVRISSESKKIN